MQYLCTVYSYPSQSIPVCNHFVSNVKIHLWKTIASFEQISGVNAFIHCVLWKGKSRIYYSHSYYNSLRLYGMRMQLAQLLVPPFLLAILCQHVFFCLWKKTCDTISVNPLVHTSACKIKLFNLFGLIEQFKTKLVIRTQIIFQKRKYVNLIWPPNVKKLLW